MVHELTASGRQHDVSAAEADEMVAIFDGRSEYEILRWWDQVSYTVAVRKAGELWPFISWGVGLPWVGQV